MGKFDGMWVECEGEWEMWELHQFEDDEDEEPIFSATVAMTPNDGWMAICEQRWRTDAKRFFTAANFETKEEAMAYAEALAYEF